MNKISNNRFLDAFLKLLLVSAIIHLSIIVVFLIITKNIKVLNYFNILDIDSFFPEVINGTLSQILSAGIVIFIYIVIFFFFTKSKR